MNNRCTTNISEFKYPTWEALKIMEYENAVMIARKTGLHHRIHFDELQYYYAGEWKNQPTIDPKEKWKQIITNYVWKENIYVDHSDEVFVNIDLKDYKGKQIQVTIEELKP